MKRGIFGEKIPIFGFALLRFAPQLRLTDTMKESEFTSLVLPLRDRMFRYAQSLLLSPAEAEDAVHDLLERLWRERGRLEGCRRVDSFVMTAVRNRCLDPLPGRCGGGVDGTFGGCRGRPLGDARTGAAGAGLPPRTPAGGAPPEGYRGLLHPRESAAMIRVPTAYVSFRAPVV